MLNHIPDVCNGAREKQLSLKKNYKCVNFWYLGRNGRKYEKLVVFN